MKHIDLFTGIAGFTILLQGISKPVAYCDIDADVRRVLRRNIRLKRLPVAPIVEDIRLLPDFFATNSIRSVDILTASSPCVGFSRAGKREGFQNPESALFGWITILAKLLKPSIILLENTPEISSSVNMKIVDSLLSDLQYNFAWTIVPAYSVGSPQSRKRWFCLAWKQTPVAQSFFKKLVRKDILSTMWRKERVPRCIASVPFKRSARMRMLGNTIVPQCALFAYQHIVEQLKLPWSSVEGISYKLKKPDLQIVVQGDDILIKFPLWPTPRAQKTSACSKLTSVRIGRDLPTTLQFAKGSPPGVFNVNWLEWLMGYPPYWTRLEE